MTAALALLLAPDKELAGVYLFLGYYPVLQPALDRISSRLLRTVCKLAVFNGAVLALYFLLLHVLGLNLLESEFAAYSRPFLLVLLAGGNLVFLPSGPGAAAAGAAMAVSATKALFPALSLLSKEMLFPPGQADETASPNAHGRLENRRPQYALSTVDFVGFCRHFAEVSSPAGVFSACPWK